MFRAFQEIRTIQFQYLLVVSNSRLVVSNSRRLITAGEAMPVSSLKKNCTWCFLTSLPCREITSLKIRASHLQLLKYRKALFTAQLVQKQAQNHGVAWVGTDLRLSSLPPAKGRAAPHQIRLLAAPFNLSSNACRDEAPTASLAASASASLPSEAKCSP